MKKSTSKNNLLKGGQRVFSVTVGVIYNNPRRKIADGSDQGRTMKGPPPLKENRPCSFHRYERFRPPCHGSFCRYRVLASGQDVSRPSQITLSNMMKQSRATGVRHGGIRRRQAPQCCVAPCSSLWYGVEAREKKLVSWGDGMCKVSKPSRSEQKPMSVDGLEGFGKS